MTGIFRPNAVKRAGRAGRRRFHPAMRVKPLLAVLLSAALVLPPSSHAQRASAPPLEPATDAAPSISTVPSGIATGVFGTYGGAESRFSGAGGTSAPAANLRAPLRALELPDLGDGSGGSLTPQAERRLGERVMREVRRDPDYLDDWLVRDYLNAMAARLAAAAAARFIGGYTPEAVGDYVGGSNHVLPTARSARFSSGLNVLDFVKRTSILKCDPDSLRAIGGAAVTLGEAEGLTAHARSVSIRLNALGA